MSLDLSYLHLGMDEAFGLALGRYHQKYGPHDPSQVFLKHLAQVVELCHSRCLRPMMWSDMFFALSPGSNGYYDMSASIPDFVRKSVPAIDLVYWGILSYVMITYVRRLLSYSVGYL